MRRLGYRLRTRREAAQAGEIVVLAVPWPAMETVAQNLGSLDGYFVSMVETSSAEMIQQWNPGAWVVKAFATLGSYVVDDPGVVGGPVSVPIASDDREAKEKVASIILAMGLDPLDAGPLRLAREIEALQPPVHGASVATPYGRLGALFPTQLFLGMHLGRRLVESRRGRGRPR